MRLRTTLFLAAFAAAPAAAQDAVVSYRISACAIAASGEADLLAQRHAPVLWFGPGEQYFPTLPFYTAIDDLDNENPDDGRVDFQDPDEIAPLADGELDRKALDSLYLHYPLRERLRRGAAFYRVRELTDVQRSRFARILHSDQQMVRRLDDGRLNWDRERIESTPMAVIEYYFYYVNDRGLKGHLEDIEFVFMFVPFDPQFADSFRVVVGAGHTDRNPNNVLVMSGLIPAMDRRPHVIVELGGHASAPDVAPHGTFQAGLDANWHPYDLWGVRDFLATGGRGYYGNYEAWKSFPRIAGLTPRLFPRGERPADADTLTGEYALVPIDVLNGIYRAAERPPTERPGLASAIRQLSAYLDPNTWEACEFADALYADGSADAVARIRRWEKDLRTIPDHAYFKSPPERIFRRQLYRPVAGVDRIPVLLRIGTRGFMGGNVYGTAGIVVPALRGFMRVPGFIEAHIGVQRGIGGEVGILGSLVFQQHWNQFTTWYAEASYHDVQTRDQDGIYGSSWALGGGLSVQPLLIGGIRGSGAYATRLRIGASAAPRLDEFRWEAALQQSISF